MCKTIKVLKAQNIFHASFPLHHRPKEEASILARGLGFSVANVDVVSLVVLCLCVFLALSPMLPSLTAPTQDLKRAGPGLTHPRLPPGPWDHKGLDTTGPDLPGL